MRPFHRTQLIIPLVILYTILACNFPLPKPQIEKAVLARDYEGNLPTSVFMQQDTFYGIAKLINSTDEAIVKATWIAVNPEGIESIQVINKTEINTNNGIIHFELKNETPWPKGFYQLELYLNGELNRVLVFEVQ